MGWLPAAGRYDAMPYRRCGRSGLLLPAISLGLWQNFGEDRPLESAREIVLRAFDLGVTQVPAREPRPVAAADGARVRRHLLLAPVRSRHAAGGDVRGPGSRGAGG